MKVFAAAVVAALAAPAAALATEPSLAVHDVPVRAGKALGSPAPARFNLVGIHWQGSGSVEFRTRSLAGRWSAWREAAPEIADLPDALSPESAARPGWRLGNPLWVGEANAIRYRTRGQVTRLRTSFVRSPAVAVPPRRLALAAGPQIVPRAAWKANESIRRGGPAYAVGVRFAVVHHTAGTNNYTAAQSPAIVRGIQLYHVRSNGWDDIGYNFLVDKYGQVFEGRFGGVEQNVVGAHAEGFNTGSVGIALLGSYEGTTPPARVLDAIAQLIAWRLDVAHVDPLSALSFVSGGSSRFPSGAPVPLPAVAGHRDTGKTVCPGLRLYRQLPTIARKAAEIGLPKLYEPLVQGQPGRPVRFTGRLSAPLVWSVTVSDEAGTVLARGDGMGQAVDWTWDATLVPAGRYRYTIEAGPDVRPATGMVGQAPATLAVAGAQALQRVITPNGDKVSDSTAIAYTLTLPAVVTATVRNVAGQVVSTLFADQQKPAGRQTFRFGGEGLVDGRYTIVVEARANGRQARAEIPVTVDRLLAAFGAKPATYSPNGDGRLDEIAFSFVLTAGARVKIRVPGGPTVFESELQPGAHRIPWGGKLRHGRHAAVIEATGPLGTRAQTVRFMVDIRKPRLVVISASALRFSVDEPVTIVARVRGRRIELKVGPGRFTLPGPAGRPFTVAAWDAGGNRSVVSYR